jgi:hypothetical protein
MMAVNSVPDFFLNENRDPVLIRKLRTDFDLKTGHRFFGMGF